MPLRPARFITTLIATAIFSASPAIADDAAKPAKPATRPSSRPTTSPTTAATSRPSKSSAAGVVIDFFDALRREDLAASRKLCWAPPGEFEKAFGREWPRESKKMAAGKRVVAVIDGKESADLAIVMFNEDVTAKNFAGKLEPLWLVKRDGTWKLLIGVNANVLASLPKEKSQSGELRKWFNDRKRQIVEEHEAAGKP